MILAFEGGHNLAEHVRIRYGTHMIRTCSEVRITYGLHTDYIRITYGSDAPRQESLKNEQFFEAKSRYGADMDQVRIKYGSCTDQVRNASDPYVLRTQESVKNRLFFNLFFRNRLFFRGAN